MAIIKSEGLSVTCVVDGQPLPEYDDPDPISDGRMKTATKRCDKYIESRDDANFVIRLEAMLPQPWLDQDRDHALDVELEIDGEWVDNTLLVDSRAVDVSGYAATDGSDATLQKFKFTAIETKEGGNQIEIEADTRKARYVGLVRVTFRRNRILRRTAPSSYQKKPTRRFSLAAKALKGKALSHATGFTNTTATPMPKFWHARRVDTSYKVVFNFRYRSKGALRQDVIIPRSPSPPTREPPRVGFLPVGEILHVAQGRLVQHRLEQEDDSTWQQSRQSREREFSAVELTADEPLRTFTLPIRGATGMDVDRVDD